MHTAHHDHTEALNPAACMAALICENAVLARQLAAAQKRGSSPAVQAVAPLARLAPLAPLPAVAEAKPLRRKLYHLPPAAHELLLALSLSPQSLRTDVSRALARMHRKTVCLQGSDADLLYSVLHDLGTRNVLSEALHRRLQARHAACVQRLAKMRSADEVRAVWLQALRQAQDQVDKLAGPLWALLTHPLGADLEVQALAQARYRVLEQARSSAKLAAEQQASGLRMAQLNDELTDLRRRLQTLQQTHDHAKAAWQQTASTWAGQARHWQMLAQAAQHPQHPPHPQQGKAAAQRCVAEPAGNPAPKWPEPAAVSPAHSASSCPAVHGTAATALLPTTPAAPAASAITATTTAATVCTAAPGTPASASLQGQRVLCVGGIQHAVARYRSRIETLGGHFDHHDGGLHDNPQALHSRLGRADLVICQAGCINHAAYHCIKAYCQKSGTPCLYLERPSLSRLDLALRQWRAGAEAKRPT